MLMDCRDLEANDLRKRNVKIWNRADKLDLLVSREDTKGNRLLRFISNIVWLERE